MSAISISTSKCASLVLIVKAIVYIIIAYTRLLSDAQLTRCVLVGTIDISYIAATEHVAITIEKTLLGANHATVDMHLRLSEDIAVGV